MRGANSYGTVETYYTNRIIPACAGQTRDEIIKHGASPDHPRMRGANLAFASSAKPSLPQRF